MIEDIKNVVNILFFITVGVVGVLTYRHARKTVFAPMRTETFKLQLKVFEELLLFFQHKGETDFTEEFDFQRILTLNAMQMRDAYAASFFSDRLKADEAAQREAYSSLKFGLVHMDDLQVLQVLDENSHRDAKPAAAPLPESPALVLANWKTYKHSIIGYTAEHEARTKELKRFIASPLLPQKLRDLLEVFHRSVGENLSLVRKVVTDSAQRMPEQFSTAEEVMAFRSDWIWNLYNNESKELEPLAKEILIFINKYLSIDNLLSSDA